MSELNKTATALLAELLIQNKQQFELITSKVEQLTSATTNEHNDLTKKVSLLEDTIKQIKIDASKSDDKTNYGLHIKSDKLDELKNELINEIKKELSNVLSNELKNELINEIKNELKNALSNELKNELKNDSTTKANSKDDDKAITMPARLQKVLQNTLNPEEMTKLYKAEYEKINELYKKYDFSMEQKSLISRCCYYKKSTMYGGWLVKIQTDVVIDNLRDFLVEYFGLEFHNDPNNETKLKKHLCQHELNREYIFRCTDETLYKLVIPLSTYNVNYVDSSSYMDYTYDIKKHYKVKYNKDREAYQFSFPFNKFSDYEEYYNINRAFTKEISTDKNPVAAATDEQLKDAYYKDKIFLPINIYKSYPVKEFINDVYIPKFNPSKEQLIELLTEN